MLNKQQLNEDYGKLSNFSGTVFPLWTVVLLSVGVLNVEAQAGVPPMFSHSSQFPQFPIANPTGLAK